MRNAVEIQQEIMVAAAGDYTDDEGYQTTDDGDIDDADRDADRAAHVLSTLIDDRIPADEIEENFSRLSCLAISLDALDHTEHCEVVLNLVDEMCVLMDTCATRSIQGDFKNIVRSKKLRVPSQYSARISRCRGIRRIHRCSRNVSCCSWYEHCNGQTRSHFDLGVVSEGSLHRRNDSDYR